MNRSVPVALLLSLAIVGCDDGSTAGPGTGPSRDAGGNDTSRPRNDGGGDDTASEPDLSSDATAESDGPVESDVGADPDTSGDVSTACDVDGDGYESIGCGGDDCNDADVFTHPDAAEACDFVDQDCNSVLNNGAECVVYAHSSTTLYLIDPFNNTAANLGSVPGLFDLDTDRSGTLYGITSSTLYRYDPGGSAWSSVGSLSTGFGFNANGFAIDSSGRAWVTAGYSVFNVDLTTADTTLVGEIGDPSAFNSSGDCVVDKADRIYMTSNAQFGADELVSIDGRTGEGTVIGSTGTSSIYGLTAAWGFLFGFAAGGEVVLINPSTGDGEVLHTFRDIIFYGAASSPGR